MNTVTRILAATITDSLGSWDTRIEFGYDPDDPYAVHLTFGNAVIWSFARDTLACGLRVADGIGDVRVWPGADRIYMGLSSPDGAATLALARGPVEEFVHAMVAAVPPGAERDHVDVDGWIAAMLTGGAA